jgi:hypothetical protein
MEIRKDEKYIKELLVKRFKNVGTFQQFEFTSWGMDGRPDFVILEEDKFTYFEIKSEHDSLARLENQIRTSRSLFTDMFLVAPKKHIDKAEESIPYFHYYCGAYALEDLEAGITKPLSEQMIRGHVSIKSIANILWSNELYNYVKNTQIYINGDLWSKPKLKENKKELFELIYTDSDSLRILNEVLPHRNWNYRKAREYIRS